MRSLTLLLLILALPALACASLAGPATDTPIPGATLPPSSGPSPDPVSSATSTPTAAPTATQSAPVAGLIRVDTLEQEVYPFVQNGKCSLAEAIYAANAGQPQDGCAAGVPGATVIELLPGEYHFTKRDQTPPQVEWFYSTVTAGDALPPVLYSLTIHGNGASLIRDEGAEPFRFFELMFGTLSLDNLTLQNGDAGDDWGGAINSRNASLTLEKVRFVGNSAQNGGGVYFDLGAVTANNCEFVSNHASYNGGAMFLDSSRADIQSSRFEENQVEGEGGALYATTVRLNIRDGFFLKNKVTGQGLGTYGGGIYASHVDMHITDSQFYQNEAPMYGGAISLNNPIKAGIDPEEGDPIEQLQQSPMTSDMLTSIPGFQATLEAHPSGIFVDFNENAEIHNSCFANNVTINPEDPNWTSGLLGRAAEASDNYWGAPSGPSGMGPGTGDSVGKRLTFSPFLTTAPDFCDPTLATKK